VSPADVAETCYVGLEHMVPGRRYIDAWGSSGDVESAKFRFESGDVLFGKLRPYLRKVSMAPHEGVCSTDILVLAPRQADDGGFLLYLCQSERVLQFAIATSGGTRMPRTSWSDLRDCPVLLPPPEERRRIAAVLRSVDEAIERTEAVIAALREVKRGMMQELLTKGIGHTEFVESRVGLMPRAWHLVRLGELVESMRNGLARSVLHEDVGLPMVRSSNITRDGIDLQDMKYWYPDDPDGEDLSKFELEAGDLIVTRVNSVELTGMSALFTEQARPHIYSSNLFRVRVRRSRLLPEYAFLFFQGEVYWRHVTGIIKPAVNQASFPQPDFLSMLVPLPPIEEQQEAVSTVAAATDAVTALLQDAGRLQTLKRGLMQQLLTGKVRVKV